MDTHLLGGLEPSDFLARHWQKKPLFVRGALPGFADLLSPSELAGLALEKGIHARLVMEKGGKRPWQVETGPFAAKRLKSLPRSHWTLLVSNIEQWVDAAAPLLDKFNFIPTWRADDLMVSFAPLHGTVGPHVDNYDVFLIQGLGRRRWSICEHSQADLAFKPGLDLKILKRFEATDSWDLEPGDMLYLPPGVPHYGVALEECLTYSVGFRAPTRGDLLSDFCNLPAAVAESISGREDFYTDPGLELASNPGAITPDALRRIDAMMFGTLRQPAVLGRWFGAFITRDSVWQEPSRGKKPSAAQLLKMLQGGAVIRRTEMRRMTYFVPPEKSDAFYFYVTGDELPLPRSLLAAVEALCKDRALPGSEFLALLPKGAARAKALDFLRELISRGAISAVRI